MHLDDVADGETVARTDDGGASSVAMRPFDPPSQLQLGRLAHTSLDTANPIMTASLCEFDRHTSSCYHPLVISTDTHRHAIIIL
jgi:hypothetical protein